MTRFSMNSAERPVWNSLITISFHDGPELLDRILTEHPEVEFVQLQLNYLDWKSAGVQSEKCYDVCVKHGKPVIVMEPVCSGTSKKR